MRASGGGRRGGARALTPLVGREEELDLLARRWERARERRGPVRARSSASPASASRGSIEEFRARLGETPHTWVEWSSSQLLQNTPLHPIAEWGRQRFGADAPAEQRLADLENTLRLIGLDPAEYAPLLAPLVDIPLPEDRAAKLAPEELRRRQLAAMTAWVLAGRAVAAGRARLRGPALGRPDLARSHAARSPSAARRRRCFIIATTRPEFRAPWSLRSHHSVISLAPLDRAEVAQMVGETRRAPCAVAKRSIEGVSERTGGVPLFVEEVTRLLLERGEQGGAQAIPPTLQQSLAARLDRLGAAREVAQIGAVLGRDFTYALLRAVGRARRAARSSPRWTGSPTPTSCSSRAPAPQANYRFKHALIQDAAYDSLLKSRRQALHRRAAEVLRDSPSARSRAGSRSPIISPRPASTISRSNGGARRATRRLRRSAFQEAIAHLGKAIAMADKAGARRAATGGAAAPSQRLTQLHVAYGNALIAARGYGAPETTEAFARARESAVGDKDAPERLAADYGLWVGSYVRGELPSMRAHAAAFLSDVEARPDSPEAGVAHRAAGITHWFAGEYREARDHLERALALFQPGRDDDLAFRFGQDAGVARDALPRDRIVAAGRRRSRGFPRRRRATTRIAGLTHVGTHALCETCTRPCSN